VNWKGDESQFSLMFSDKQISPDYYVNVKNAFQSAPALVQACRDLPGEKVVLAHSLGNMLVSSAAKDHGLNYSKYYMLNAAVPMEAYDNGSFSSVMCDEEWEKVPSNYLAANWSKLFPANDFRSSLSWRGRFAGIANAINCYSPTEDVLANAEVGQLTLSGGAWKIQEFTKGTTVWHELNSIPFLDLNVACEGGWGINTYYSLNPLWYVYQYGFTDKVQSDMTREDAIMYPLFTPFRSESEAMHSTNLFTIADAMYREQLRAKFLGDAIPATSFAAGANHTDRGLTNLHNASLRGACLCAEKKCVGKIKGILHISCGMVGRNVKLFKTIMVGFNLRTVYYVKAHTLKNVYHIFKYGVKRMKRTCFINFRWHSNIDGFCLKFFFLFLCF
jgi:hypothetical protein